MAEYGWLVLVAGALALLTGYMTYQLLHHPLARYPGPLLGRITPLYDLYHAYMGDKHVVLYQLHQTYGTFVRFTPNTLSINDPVALKSIYGHTANVQKSEFYRCFRVTPIATSTLLATEKHQHARKRRVMGQAFSDQAMKGMEQYVLTHVQNMIDRISIVVEDSADETGWSSALNMQNWCNWLVFDIMGELVFGRSFDTLGDRPENREGIRLLGQAARRNYTVSAMPSLMYSGLEKWLPPFRELFLDRAKYLAFGKEQVMAKTKEQADGLTEVGRQDIFSFLLTAKDPETGEGISMPELWMEGNTLIVAGSDTSSTNPDTLTRLEYEVRRTFAHADEIRQGSKLQGCRWLRACIDEAMRLSPAVPGLLPREVLPGGLNIPALDVCLPPGVNVGVCTYAIHHHADYVVEPFKFDPLRWLEGEHNQDKEALQAVFNPFSLGHRACLGKPLVYMELSIAIARLVFEYDMRMAADQKIDTQIARELSQGKRHEEEYHMQDWFLSNNFGPYAHFQHRNHSSVDAE